MKDFNVYKWRREQINEEVSNEVLADKVYNNIEKYLSKEYKGPSYKNFITSAIIRGLSTLNEELTSKQIKDLTIDDVKGLTVPTKDVGTRKKINNETDLNDWKNSINQDLEVQIDTELVWYDQVKIPGLKQSDWIGSAIAQDKAEGRPPRLD